MSDSTKNIELIERYFDNEMTDEEKVQFHHQLKSDLALKHLYDREHLLVNTIRFGAAKNHLDFFKELEKSLPDVEVARKNITWPFYAVAASVLILIAAGVYIFTTQDPNVTELYSQNFTPYPNVFEPTVRGEVTMTERKLAFQKYSEGDYQQAVQLFSALLNEKREPEIVFLLGNAHLSLGKTEDARNNFNEVIRSSPTLVGPAQWYLGLTYLKEGKTSAAIETFKVVAAGNSTYSGKADKLLKQLQQ